MIAAYGVSVETVDEALTAIARRGTATVQIIFNAFRLKPLEFVLPGRRGRPGSASSPGCRWPAACSAAATRRSTDVRRERSPHLQPAAGRRSTSARRSPESTSTTGVAAAQEFSELVWDRFRGDVTPAQAALAWIIQTDGVTAVIPGARSVEQVRANAAAADVRPWGRSSSSGSGRSTSAAPTGGAQPAGEAVQAGQTDRGRAAGDTVVDRLQQGTVEGREVAGVAAGDQVAVDDDLLVHPGAAGVADVGLQARPGGEPPAADHVGLDQGPGCVADGRHRLAGGHEARR